ncbi:MAG TPA: guanylate kinase [Smithellaceae bacterium]|jgi:guanylate kinase|nr:guanylate kinase [Smithellaceae bacterium]HNT91353.1 guanylate kinase [Smithellaceae bacterium]HNV63672.1 guanylate kinase [Smithellaceae bacterium]HNZ31472.1 guanylate kinase [Smithellaceae bacterium]HOD31475.1 guanylate kinase [Smithellaceae bacterium]
MKQGLFLVVSAPSGAGKSSICQGLLDICPQLNFSVSYTSRPPRPQEVNGKDYHFVSRENFLQRVKRGEFVEWVESFGHLYGTSRKTVDKYLQTGKDLLLDLEPRGAKKIKKIYRGGVFVFVLPPSRDDFLKRLKKRGHESEEVIQARLAQAESELKEISWYTYVIFNKDLKEAVKQLHSIYIAEKCRKEILSDEIKKFMQK